MATQVARQAAASARRPTVSVGVPIAFRHCPAAYVLRFAKGLRARALRESSPPVLPVGAWAIGCADARRSFEVRGTVITASLSKEKQDEIQPARHGRGRSVSRAPASSGEPGIGSRRRLPATLVAHCPRRLLPAQEALRGAAAASRLERA
jgi:hypothetical protein